MVCVCEFQDFSVDCERIWQLISFSFCCSHSGEGAFHQSGALRLLGPHWSWTWNSLGRFGAHSFLDKIVELADMFLFVLFCFFLWQMGLEGEQPQSVDPESIEGRVKKIQNVGEIHLLKERLIKFDYQKVILIS